MTAHTPCECWEHLARTGGVVDLQNRPPHHEPCCFADDHRPNTEIPPGGPLACGCDHTTILDRYRRP